MIYHGPLSSHSLRLITRTYSQVYNQYSSPDSVYTHTMQRITYSERKMRARKASGETEKSKQEDKMGAVPLVNRVIKWQAGIRECKSHPGGRTRMKADRDERVIERVKSELCGEIERAGGWKSGWRWRSLYITAGLWNKSERSYCCVWLLNSDSHGNQLNSTWKAL